MTLDSEQYSFNDITLIFGGRTINTLNGVKVTHGWEHVKGRGKGGKAQFINETAHDVEGSFKILQSDYEAMVNTYGDKLQKTYFDLIWVFVVEGGIPRTHVVRKLKIGKIDLELNQGDGFMEIEIPFMALDFKQAV